MKAEEIIKKWNNNSDEYNYWDMLSEDEQCLLLFGADDNQWISVKDRLPEAIYVLCCHNNSRPCIGSYGIWGQYWICEGEKIDVTHWQPLPLPPEKTLDNNKT